MLPNIHILGIQGSGKGTQSALLVEQYNFTYASSGNLFRERAAKEDKFAKDLEIQLKAGHLLANSYLVHTIEDFLNTNTPGIGFLGDGVIRTLDQYEELLPVWTKYNLDEPLLIHLQLNENTALERIQKRQSELSDPEKQEYHRKYSGKLMYRSDDNPHAIQERFALFHSMTQPVINLFDSKKLCIHVSADQAVEKIHQEIDFHLELFYPELSHGTN